MGARGSDTVQCWSSQRSPKEAKHSGVTQGLKTEGTGRAKTGSAARGRSEPVPRVRGAQAKQSDPSYGLR